MSLIDTTDNILMLGAYGWAFVKPIRKLYYNMTITLRIGDGGARSSAASKRSGCWRTIPFGREASGTRSAGSTTTSAYSATGSSEFLS